MLGAVGVVYIFYAVVAVYVVTANRINDFGISLQGESIPKSAVIAGLGVHASIQPAFYLALATGCFLLLLAIIRLILYKINIDSPKTT